MTIGEFHMMVPQQDREAKLEVLSVIAGPTHLIKGGQGVSFTLPDLLIGALSIEETRRLGHALLEALEHEYGRRTPRA